MCIRDSLDLGATRLHLALEGGDLLFEALTLRIREPVPRTLSARLRDVRKIGVTPLTAVESRGVRTRGAARAQALRQPEILIHATRHVSQGAADERQMCIRDSLIRM